MPTRTVYIPEGIDRKYRKALLAALSRAGPKASWYIRNALIDGPSRGGALESMQYFGKELDTKLKLTAPIIDGLEVSVTGFKHWLHDTGFGNDKRMILGFVAWAEHMNGPKKIITQPEADIVFHAQQ